jgi:hypothetical protein
MNRTFAWWLLAAACFISFAIVAGFRAYNKEVQSTKIISEELLISARDERLPRISEVEQQETAPQLVSVPATATDEVPATPEAEVLELTNTIRGHVFSASGNPEVGVHVAFSQLKERSGEVTTDENGAFVIQLSAKIFPYHSVGTLVVANDDSDVVERKLWEGAVQIEPVIDVFIPDPLTLRGQIITDSPISLEHVVVIAEIPAGPQLPHDTYAGQAWLFPDGRFATTHRNPMSIPWKEFPFVRLSFSYSPDVAHEESQFLGSVLVSSEKLLSLAGAEIEMNLQTVDIEVRGAEGPLEGVTIFGLRSSDTNRTIFRTTNADGKATVMVQATKDDPWELCFVREGYLSLVEYVGVETLSLRIFMDPIPTSRTLLQGKVKDELGGGIPDAQVIACIPSVTTVGLYANISTQSGSDGSFRLELPFKGIWEVVAYHGDYSSIPWANTSIVHDQNRDFVLPAAGSLTVHLTAGPLLPMESDNRIHAFLVDRNLKRETHYSHFKGSPLVMKGIPPGEYNLFVWWDKKGGWGQESVTIIGKGQEVTAHLNLVNPLTGIVRGLEGNPIPLTNVTVNDPLLPASFIEGWGRGTTDEFGFFSVQTGGAENPNLQLVIPGGETHHAVGGGTITLPVHQLVRR